MRELNPILAVMVRGGYESISMQGMRVLISGVREYKYPGYEGIKIRGTRVLVSGVRGC